MLGRLKTWVSGLSLFGKVIAFSTAAVVGGTVISAVANPSNTTPPEQKPSSANSSQEEQVQKSVVEKKTITETTVIPFEKTTVEDSNLEKGKSVLRIAGVNGVKTFTYEVTYTDGVETDKRLISENVSTPPVAEATALGTKEPKKQNCDPNYTPCVPNVSYDLDCPDIGFSVTVIGYDHHGFDGNDNDGYGCESY